MIPPIRLTAGNAVLRLLEPGDLPGVRELYQSNVPEFLPQDSAYLDSLNEDAPNYFVVECQGRVVAGAGIDLGQTGEQCFLYSACVHREFHGQGIGSLLMLARLAWTEGDPALVWAVVPPRVAAFYERFGFERIENPQKAPVHPGLSRFARWVHGTDRAEIQTQLRALPVQDRTGLTGSGECQSSDPAEG